MKAFKFITAVFLLSGFIAGLGSCSSDDDDDGLSYGEQMAIDTVIIDEYLKNEGIVAVKHNSGLRYLITKDSISEHPNLSDVVIVNYEGRFLGTGEVFDSGQGVSFPVGGVIAGWQIGLQEMSEGTSAVLYIPSGLAYGSAGNSSIPPNSILVFDIDLIEVK